MAPTAQTLFGLFGDPTESWPSDAVRQHTGHQEAGDPPSPAAWLGALENSVRVQTVRGGALADRVSVEAELTVDPAGFLGHPDGWPFVIVSMPDVEFRIKPYAQSGRSTRLFASVRDAGFELVLEGLPVEIRLPPGLVAAAPRRRRAARRARSSSRPASSSPGRLDDLKVIQRRFEPTSIFVHVRLYVNEAYEVHIQPAVPISFGRCGLSGLPCRAVHDFRLIPSPQLAFQELPNPETPLPPDREPNPDNLPADRPQPGHFEWLRHRVEPWLPSHAGSHDGLFSVRSVDVDEEAKDLEDAVKWLNYRTRDTDPAADLVLGDMVVPFLGPFWLPVPRHLTVGIRRKVLDPGSKSEVFAFERAPVHVFLDDDPKLAFNVESFFYRSQPAADIREDLGLTFSAALVFGDDQAPQHAFEVGLEEDYTIVVGYKRDFSSTGTACRCPRPAPRRRSTRSCTGRSPAR